MSFVLGWRGTGKGSQHRRLDCSERASWKIDRRREHVLINLQPQRLFSTRVPHTHHQHKPWINRRLQRSQKEPIRRYPTKRNTCRRCNENNTPNNRCQRQEFPNGETLKQVAGRELEEQVSEVEDGSYQPTIASISNSS
jgi:hypothetical protein